MDLCDWVEIEQQILVLLNDIFLRGIWGWVGGGGGGAGGRFLCVCEAEGREIPRQAPPLRNEFRNFL